MGFIWREENNMSLLYVSLFKIEWLSYPLFERNAMHVPQKLPDAYDNGDEDAHDEHHEQTAYSIHIELAIIVDRSAGITCRLIIIEPLALQIIEHTALAQLQYAHTKIRSKVGI